MDHIQETGIELLSPSLDGADLFLDAIFNAEAGQQILDDVYFTFSGV